MALFIELEEYDRIGEDAEGSVFIRDAETGRTYLSKAEDISLGVKIRIYPTPIGLNYMGYIRWVKEVRKEGESLSVADIKGVFI